MTISRRDFAVFAAVAYGTAWIVAAGPWLDGQGLTSPWLPPGAAVMMLAPTIATLVVWRLRRIPLRDFVSGVGLDLGHRPRRTLLTVLVVWLTMPLFPLVRFLVDTGFGWLDLGARYSAETTCAMLVMGVFVSVLQMVPLALGEEIGWRGWLLPRLTDRLGVPIALITTGVVWGLWHAPLTLLGYGFTDLGAWAALAYIPFCAIFGTLLGWLRLWTGSVWPSTVAHAANNTIASVLATLFVADIHQTRTLLLILPDLTLTTILGTTLFLTTPIPRPITTKPHPTEQPTPA
ncbi:CPBP family glutamic-type intramembrane protease [Nocardia sp. NPDC003482]